MTYGQVIYAKNPEAEKQLYIIAQWHRNEFSEATSGRHIGSGVPQVQTEIFRLFEQLMRSKDVGLIMDEGLVGDVDYSEKSELEELDSEVKELLNRFEISSKNIGKADDSTIEKVLETTEISKLNVACLLKAIYNIDIQGAEGDVHGYLSLRSSMDGRYPSDEPEGVYQLRNAQLLQNSPKVIEREYEAGNIPNKRGVMGIGVGHLDYMLEVLEKERIEIGPFTTKMGMNFSGMDKNLELYERDYGVTVIVPNTVDYEVPENITTPPAEYEEQLLPELKIDEQPDEVATSLPANRVFRFLRGLRWTKAP